MSHVRFSTLLVRTTTQHAVLTQNPRTDAMRFLKLLGRLPCSLGITNHCYTPLSMMKQTFYFSFSSHSAEEEMGMREFNEYMNSLKNYEKSGVPRGAGTDSDGGFDLGRMRRLLGRLGNPHTRFKAVHIAGTKGKGSTAAFLSNILRAEGYRVGCYTSPHIQTIRERISVGKSGEPVEVGKLDSLLREIKGFIDESMEHENGLLSHFEVFTAMAFVLFARENVDIAVIEAGLGGARDATNVLHSHEVVASIITTIGEEHLDALGGSLESIAIAKAGIIKQGRPVVLGGPFLSHVMDILCRKATSMGSPVVLASGPGNISSIRGMSVLDGRPCQSCDIMMNIEGDLRLSVQLPDVKLFMLGRHQLQNAVTATCSALCLRKLGWTITDRSIRDGLESTCLLGRTQFLTSKEADALGLPEATILLDGAHTKESAKALVDTIKMAFPAARLAVVVAMANDKDHVAFAKEFLSGARVVIAVLTEVNIAGGSNRTASSISLRDSWIQASEELGINVHHDKMNKFQASSFFENCLLKKKMNDRIILAADNSLSNSMQVASEILKKRAEDESAILVVTGSLHIVSSVLSAIRKA